MSATTSRARRALPVVGVMLTLLALGLYIARSSDRPSGRPFDPASARPEGTLALVRLLRELDAEVTVATLAPPADADTALLSWVDFDDDTTRQWRDWIRDGGVLVLTDANSELAPRGVASGGFQVTDLGPELQVRPRCDVAALADLPPLDVSEGGLSVDPQTTNSDLTVCFRMRQDRAAVAIEKRGKGAVVVVGPFDAFTNSGLRQAGRAELAAALLAPRPGTKVAVKGLTPLTFVTRPETLLDRLPKAVTSSLWVLLAAGVFYAFARGRRLGKPLGEPAPVEVPASELTVAAGNLLQRGHHRAHTAAMLRRGCASRIAGLLGLARTSTPEDVARALISRGADEDETLLVLCGPPPLTDRDLVVLAQHLDVMQARVDGALAGSLAPAAAGPTHTADAAPIPLSTQSAETAP